jgi:hypothetical protein
MSNASRDDAVLRHQTYPVPDGLAATFELASGDEVRLEPRMDGVVVGVSHRDLDEVASALGAAAEQSLQVHVAFEDRIEPVDERGEALTEQLRRLHDVALVRVDRAEDSVVWECGHEGSRSELSVAAPSWHDAEALVAELGQVGLSERLNEYVDILTIDTE